MPTNLNLEGVSSERLAESVSENIRDQYQYRSETPDSLTDIDGIGPQTAEKLRRVGINKPEELRGKSTATLAAVDGIGEKRAERIRADVDYEDFTGDVPGETNAGSAGIKEPFEGRTDVFPKNRSVDFSSLSEEAEQQQQGAGSRRVFPSSKGELDRNPRNISVEGRDKETAVEHMADRSQDERRTDRSFNAPLMLDVSVWKRNDEKYDYPGVDTVPKSRRLERTQNTVESLFNKGDLQAVETNREGEGRFGYFRRSEQKVSVDAGFSSDPEATFAHEVGHAVDKAIGEGEKYAAETSEIFDDPEVREQAEDLVERRRTRTLESVETSYESKDYPFERELFADVFAEVVEEPRAARREAPEAVREIEELTLGTPYYPSNPL
jgi:nucleotidyltransferase/DNA polymerase involved in DNA repair